MATSAPDWATGHASINDATVAFVRVLRQLPGYRSWNGYPLVSDIGTRKEPAFEFRYRWEDGPTRTQLLRGLQIPGDSLASDDPYLVIPLEAGTGTHTLVLHRILSARVMLAHLSSLDPDERARMTRRSVRDLAKRYSDPEFDLSDIDPSTLACWHSVTADQRFPKITATLECFAVHAERVDRLRAALT